MRLRKVFAEAYELYYTPPKSVDQRFAEDISRILRYLNTNCAGVLNFKLSNTGGSTESVVLICEDALRADERVTAMSLYKAIDEEGPKVSVSTDRGERYDVSSWQELDYLAESVVKKVAQDFAEADMKRDNLQAMRRGFHAR